MLSKEKSMERRYGEAICEYNELLYSSLSHEREHTEKKRRREER
jgi:hypothetical protein